jgi:uncharacterized protein YxeA
VRELLTLIEVIIIVSALILGGVYLLPKENWNTEERFIKRCDSGETFYMSSWDAQRCAARLLAKKGA